jgi:Lar family restriction alleviation protein
VSELLPCPFCNGEPFRQRHYGKMHQIICRGCGASSRIRKDETEIFAAWNTRPASATAVEVTEGMGQAMTIQPTGIAFQNSTEGATVVTAAGSAAVVDDTGGMVEAACAIYDPLWSCRLAAEKETIRQRMRAALAAGLGNGRRG